MRKPASPQIEEDIQNIERDIKRQKSAQNKTALRIALTSLRAQNEILKRLEDRER